LRPHEAAHGFVRGRSVVTNAAAHRENSIWIQMDIKDFFPSCDTSMVRAALMRAGVDAEEARRMTYLCTYGNRLAQGAPTSPALANLCAWRMDARLAGLAKKFGGRYTRYADDITISLNASRYVSIVLSLAREIVEDENFRVNAGKTRVIRAGGRHEACGVLADAKHGARVSRKQRRIFRARCHALKVGRNTQDNADTLRGYAAWIASTNEAHGAQANACAEGAIMQAIIDDVATFRERLSCSDRRYEVRLPQGDVVEGRALALFDGKAVTLLPLAQGEFPERPCVSEEEFIARVTATEAAEAQVIARSRPQNGVVRRLNLSLMRGGE
jgi:hypothetical protein